MGSGTTNFKSTSAQGSALAPELVNDVCTLLARADDEAIYDLFDIEPATPASVLEVNTGYIPLRGGPIVAGYGAARQVNVAPCRVVRSSIDASKPRLILSALIGALSPVAMPAAPGAGLWGIELLYAQIAYVDPTDTTKGTTATLFWAPAPTYVVFANAAPLAVLPAHTASPPTWNVPLAYVKNIQGNTSIAQKDVLSVTPNTAGGTRDGKLRRRAGAMLGGIDARRMYASTTQSLATLAGANVVVKSANTHTGVHKADTEIVCRSISLPGTATGDSGGVQVITDLDSSAMLLRPPTRLTIAGVPKHNASAVTMPNDS